MSRFLSAFTLLLLSATGALADPAANSMNKQYFEVRTYVLGESSDEAMLDQYLHDAYLPALKRLGIGPVGVFHPAESDENGQPSIVLVIPVKQVEQLANLSSRLQSDTTFLAASKAYREHGGDNPAFERIRSELLVAMDCMPQAKVPPGTLGNAKRVYELRLYESATERLGELKVDMFNNGEVPIFLDCGIQPLFLGQCVLGPQAPSLTYLTVYPSEADRLAAWKKFRAHLEWQVLKRVDKYQGTVSKIDKYILKAKPYSEM